MAKAKSTKSSNLVWIIVAVCSPLPTALLLVLNLTASTPKDTILKFLIGDWYFAGPMITMSLISTTMIIWRYLLNLKVRTDMDAFLPTFQEKLQKDGVEGARQYCNKEEGLIPRKVLASGLAASKQGIAAMKRSMATTLEHEIVPELNFLMAPILAVAKIATMVGLLGTVISMISTFTAMGNSRGANPTEVTAQSGNIGLALCATALGLMTAIPLVFAHVMFRDFIVRFETQVKSEAQGLIVLFQRIKPKQGEVKRDLKEKEKEKERGKERSTEPSRL